MLSFKCLVPVLLLVSLHNTSAKPRFVDEHINSEAHVGGHGVLKSELGENKNIASSHIDSVQGDSDVPAVKSHLGDVHSDAHSIGQGQAKSESVLTSNLGDHKVEDVHASGGVGIIGQADDTNVGGHSRSVLAQGVQSAAQASGSEQAYSESVKTKNIGNLPAQGLQTSGGVGVIGQAGDVNVGRSVRSLPVEDVQALATATGHSQAWPESVKNKNIGDPLIKDDHTSGGVGVIGQAADVNIGKVRAFSSDNVHSVAHAVDHGIANSESVKNKNIGNHQIENVHSSGGVGAIKQAGDVNVRKSRGLSWDVESGAYASGSGHALSEAAKNQNIGNHKVEGVHTSEGVGVIGQDGDINVKGLTTS